MKKITIIILLLFIFCMNTFSQQTKELSELLNELFEIQNPSKQKSAIKKILKTKYDFDTLYRYIALGKKYSDQVEKGWIEKFNKIEGMDLLSLAYIPENYNPNKKYELRFQLHGAVSTPNASYVKTLIDQNNETYKKIDYILVYPGAWLFAPWWSPRQYQHINYLINYFKSNYNIDENRIYLSGISDGALGTFYFANLNQTPWASFGTYIGSYGVFKNYKEKQIYVSNYKNKSFFIQNGKKDETFLYELVEPYNELLKQAKIDMKLVIIDTGKHNLLWYPLYKDTIKQFFKSHPRNPFPDTLNWSTEFEEQYNRCYWLKINSLTKTNNTDECIIDYNFDNKRPLYKLRRDTLFGSISAKKIKNSIYICTKNVKKFSILLSPSHFDFNEKIKIYLEDNLIFDNFVTKDISVLLNWAIQDFDREMLFGTELLIKTGKKPDIKTITY